MGERNYFSGNRCTLWDLALSETPFRRLHFQLYLFNESVWIWIKISLKFVADYPIENKSALVQVMAWCGPGDRALSEAMLVCLPTHICITRPQRVKKGFCWLLKNIKAHFHVIPFVDVKTELLDDKELCILRSQHHGCCCLCDARSSRRAQRARSMGPTWGPPGADRTQVGPMCV